MLLVNSMKMRRRVVGKIHSDRNPEECADRRHREIILKDAAYRASSGSLPQQSPGDDDAHDLVGAFEDLVDADVAQMALDREVLEVAVAAVQL